MNAVTLHGTGVHRITEGDSMTYDVKDGLHGGPLQFIIIIVIIIINHITLMKAVRCKSVNTANKITIKMHTLSMNVNA